MFFDNLSFTFEDHSSLHLLFFFIFYFKTKTNQTIKRHNKFSQKENQSVMSNGVGPSWLTSPLPEDDLASLREDLRAFDSAVQQTIAELEGFALFDEAEESPCGEAAALLELCWQALDSPPTGDASPALALSETCWKRLQER